MNVTPESRFKWNLVMFFTSGGILAITGLIILIISGFEFGMLTFGIMFMVFGGILLFGSWLTIKKNRVGAIIFMVLGWPSIILLISAIQIYKYLKQEDEQIGFSARARERQYNLTQKIANPEKEKISQSVETNHETGDTSAKPSSVQCQECGRTVPINLDKCMRCGTPRKFEE
jgi:ribosomal protein L37E